MLFFVGINIIVGKMTNNYKWNMIQSPCQQCPDFPFSGIFEA